MRTGAAKWPSRSFVAVSEGERQEGINNFGRRIVAELRSLGVEDSEERIVNLD